VTAAVPDTDKLRELEDCTRRAWKTYSARVRDLSGEEYERVERDSWAELQSELSRLDQQRLSSGVAS
jgi:hypothetical protein